MKHHANQSRCYELITETTRLRMAIEEREQYDSQAAALDAARLWVRFHRAMVELLALTPAHDREGARRQKVTADGHQAQQLAWLRMIEQLEEQAAHERQA